MNSTPPRQRIMVEESGDISVVQFVDQKIITEVDIQMVRDELFKLVDELRRRKLLLNFSNVAFMSSAMFGKLVALHNRLDEVGGKLVSCGIGKDIQGALTLLHLHKLLRIVKDEQTGLNSF